MKKIILAIALPMLGGMSLSIPSTAGAMPALKSIGEVATKDGAQNVTYGYWHWRKHHWRHHYGHYGHYYYKPYDDRHGYYGGHYYRHYSWHPRGYYGDY